MVQNLDPHIRKFLLYTISETFAEIRKFVEYRQYDREKVKSGILELCAALQIDLKDETPKTSTPTYKFCLHCGERLRRKKQGSFNPYHVGCERIIRSKKYKKFQVWREKI